MGRMNKAIFGKLENYAAFRGDIQKIPIARLPEFCLNDPRAASFFIRMLFSCLVDADYLDTEYFMNGSVDPVDHIGEIQEKEHNKIEELDEKLQLYIKDWFPPKNELNRLRCEILNVCIDNGEKLPPGLFTLTVPTGGGKTVSSLAFALRHAKKWGKRRIIYVIPYTSIIEQTADRFGEILGTENVLEHHSGVQYEIDESLGDENIQKAKAIENWDMPVIVTTAVQFFESLYSNKPSKCRKLHNLAESVIIFDEAQMMPVPYLRPCIYAIAQLAEKYGVSVVLCTATQPALEGLFQKYLPEKTALELCPAEIRNHLLFKRVHIQKRGKVSWESLAEDLNVQRQVLCIVNSRKNAYTLFRLLSGPGVFHLSTLMHPEHRRRILGIIRKRLVDGEACRVISTALIEAGVDVDFPVVYREEAGLDSILQAAGRCNREGKQSPEESPVIVFQAENPPPHIFKIPLGAARYVMEKQEELDSEDAIHEYFSELLSLKGEDGQDCKKIMERLGRGDFPFSSVAGDFRLIENDTRTIIIPAAENTGLINRLYEGERSRELIRQLGIYSVSVYKDHFENLLYAGDVKMLDEEIAILVNEKLYSEETGLSLKADFGKGEFI